MLPAGAAPAPYPGLLCSEGAHIVTMSQGCSAVAAAQLLIKGKSNLLISLRVLNWSVGFLLTWKK